MVNPIKSVFLFAGNDSYSKEQAIKKLKSSLLDSSSSELDYKVFDGADAEVRDILDHVSTIPFLASKRLIIIKHFEKLSKEDTSRLIDYIKNPTKSTCLVLDAEDDSIIKQYSQTMWLDFPILYQPKAQKQVDKFYDRIFLLHTLRMS